MLCPKTPLFALTDGASIVSQAWVKEFNTLPSAQESRNDSQGQEVVLGNCDELR